MDNSADYMYRIKASLDMVSSQLVKTQSLLSQLELKLEGKVDKSSKLFDSDQADGNTVVSVFDKHTHFDPSVQVTQVKLFDTQAGKFGCRVQVLSNKGDICVFDVGTVDSTVTATLIAGVKATNETTPGSAKIVVSVDSTGNKALLVSALSGVFITDVIITGFVPTDIIDPVKKDTAPTVNSGIIIKSA